MNTTVPRVICSSPSECTRFYDFDARPDPLAMFTAGKTQFTSGPGKKDKSLLRPAKKDKSDLRSAQKDKSDLRLGKKDKPYLRPAKKDKSDLRAAMAETSERIPHRQYANRVEDIAIRHHPNPPGIVQPCYGTRVPVPVSGGVLSGDCLEDIMFLAVTSQLDLEAVSMISTEISKAVRAVRKNNPAFSDLGIRGVWQHVITNNQTFFTAGDTFRLDMIPRDMVVCGDHLYVMSDTHPYINIYKNNGRLDARVVGTIRTSQNVRSFCICNQDVYFLRGREVRKYASITPVPDTMLDLTQPQEPGTGDGNKMVLWMTADDHTQITALAAGEGCIYTSTFRHTQAAGEDGGVSTMIKTLPDGNVLNTWTLPGNRGDSHAPFVNHIYYDAANKRLVYFDCHNNRLVVTTEDGAFLFNLLSPRGIRFSWWTRVVRCGHEYIVAMQTPGGIYRYDTTGGFLGTIPLNRTEQSQPMAMAAVSGALYVGYISDCDISVYK
jgi:hypothetical protein